MGTNFPNSPTNGYIWWFGENIRNFVYDSSIPAWTRRGGTALPKNYLVNPAFQVSDERGLTDLVNVTNAHIAEQWSNQYISSVGSFRFQRVVSLTPGGGNHRLRITVNTGDPTLAGDWLAIGTMLEGNRMSAFGYGAAEPSSKWGVLRFGCKGPAGNYVVAIRNSGVTRSFISPFTIYSEDHNKDHVQVMCIPPCETGTWPVDNSTWGYIQWVITNASMTSNEWDWLNGNYAGGTSMDNTFMQTAGNVFELFDVGFYLDPNITGVTPEYQVPDFTESEQDCLRYWCKLKGFRGVIATATQGRLGTGIPVAMRVGPAISLVGTPRLYDASTAPNISAVSVAGGVSANHAEIFATVAGGMVVGRPAQLLVDGNDSVYVAANARM